MKLDSVSLSHRLCPSQLPAPNSVALDMSLQTPSDVKVKEEAPVEVDSSPPDSPESISGKSDSSGEFLVKGKVGQKWEEGGLYECIEKRVEPYVERVWLMMHVIMTFAVLHKCAVRK